MIKTVAAVVAVLVVALLGGVALAGAANAASPKDNPGQGYVHSNPDAPGKGKGRQAPVPTVTRYQYDNGARPSVRTDANGDWAGPAAVIYARPGDTLDPDRAATTPFMTVGPPDTVITVTRTAPSDAPPYTFTPGGLVVSVTVHSTPDTFVEFGLTGTGIHTEVAR